MCIRDSGKPANAFFETALPTLHTSAADALMIGDDIRGDIAGAQAAGVRGLLVRTGKFRPADLGGEIRPDGVLDGIGGLRHWWETHNGGRT